MSTPATGPISLLDIYNEWEKPNDGLPFNPPNDIPLKYYSDKFGIQDSSGINSFRDKTVIKTRIGTWRIGAAGDLSTNYIEGSPPIYLDYEPEIRFYLPTADDEYKFNISWNDCSIYLYYNGLDPEDIINARFYIYYGPSGVPSQLKYQGSMNQYPSGTYIYSISSGNIDVSVNFFDNPVFRVLFELSGDLDGDYQYYLFNNNPLDISINSFRDIPGSYVFNNSGQNIFRISKFSDTIIGIGPK